MRSVIGIFVGGFMWDRFWIIPFSICASTLACISDVGRSLGQLGVSTDNVICLLYFSLICMDFFWQSNFFHVKLILRRSIQI